MKPNRLSESKMNLATSRNASSKVSVKETTRLVNQKVLRILKAMTREVKV